MYAIFGIKPDRDKVRDLRRRNCRCGAAGYATKRAPICRIDYVVAGVIFVLMAFAALEIVLGAL